MCYIASEYGLYLVLYLNDFVKLSLMLIPALASFVIVFGVALGNI